MDALAATERLAQLRRLAELRQAADANRPFALVNYHERPAAFARDFIDWRGDGLSAYQSDVLESLPESGRLAVRGGHGLGKTTIAACTVLWFALTRDDARSDWKCITTASWWRQLSKYLWPEIHKWSRRLRWDRLERAPFDLRSELLTLELKLTHGSAFAVACTDPFSIEGAHGDDVLVVYDEAKAIPPALFESTEGFFAGAGGDTGRHALGLMLSTPAEPNGYFYDVSRRAAGTEDWTMRHVTVEESIAAGRVSSEWVESKRRQWGESSPAFQSRVLGNFASTAGQSVIPLSWVEAAIERWHARGGIADVAPSWVGGDVGLTGDRTVLAPVAGDMVLTLKRPDLTGQVTPTTAIAVAIGQEMGQNPSGPSAVIDVIGVGAGVVDQVRNLPGLAHRVFAFQSAGRTEWKDRSGEIEFANLRAAAWWHLRELLDPSYEPTFCLPPDDEMIGDLTAPGYRYGAGGRLLIESKDEIRKRLGRSPDAGDGVVMGVWGLTRPIRRRAPLRLSTGPLSTVAPSRVTASG